MVLMASLACRSTWAQTAPQADDLAATEERALLSDIEAYYTAPLRWDATDWTYFAGVLAAVGVTDHFDSSVRLHFTHRSPDALGAGDPHELQDALPAVTAVAGTWMYATLFDDRDGQTVAWAMTEAAGFSLSSGLVLRYTTGRERPDQTTDPNRWFRGGSSFPSLHSTAAFAVGTVFAESGQGAFRWVTRLFGYGLAAFTGYERLKHNQHWLSDVFAGAALGSSSGAFVLQRTYGRNIFSGFQVISIERGVMLSYSTAH
jgi:membrane-associated phospholipid phosphatase